MKPFPSATLLGVCIAFTIDAMGQGSPTSDLYNLGQPYGQGASATPVPFSLAQRSYQKDVENAIGPIWYREVEKYGKAIAVGTVRVAFRVTPEGRVESLKITSNTSNQRLADISIRAIKEAHLPIMIRDRLDNRGGSAVDMELSFTVFGSGPGRTLARPRHNPSS